jgi:hypothetical protein
MINQAFPSRDTITQHGKSQQLQIILLLVKVIIKMRVYTFSSSLSKALLAAAITY